jgi:hypothetical protein
MVISTTSARAADSLDDHIWSHDAVWAPWKAWTSVMLSKLAIDKQYRIPSAPLTSFVNIGRPEHELLSKPEEVDKRQLHARALLG